MPYPAADDSYTETEDDADEDLDDEIENEDLVKEALDSVNNSTDLLRRNEKNLRFDNLHLTYFSISVFVFTCLQATESVEVPLSSIDPQNFAKIFQSLESEFKHSLSIELLGWQCDEEDLDKSNSGWCILMLCALHILSIALFRLTRFT